MGVALHKPTEVSFEQVKSPYRELKKMFPRMHEFINHAGKLGYYHVVDAIGPRTRAHPGDFVLKHPNGSIEVLTEKTFNELYEVS